MKRYIYRAILKDGAEEKIAEFIKNNTPVAEEMAGIRASWIQLSYPLIGKIPGRN